MAVAFDAVGPSSAGAGTATAASSLSWTHTAGTGPVAVVVGLGCSNNAATLSATCGGTAMTSFGLIGNNNSTSGFTQLFGLAGVAAGAQSVVISATQPALIEAGSVSYSGAALTNAAAFGTPVTAFGSSAAASASVASTSASSMVSGASSSGTGVTSVTSGTSRWIDNLNTTSAAGAGSGADIPGSGGTVTLTWSITSDFWGVVAVEVLPPGSLPGPPLSPQFMQHPPAVIAVRSGWRGAHRSR